MIYSRGSNLDDIWRLSRKWAKFSGSVTVARALSQKRLSNVFAFHPSLFLQTLSVLTPTTTSDNLKFCSTGSRGRVRVLCEETAGHALQRPQLLRGVRQRWRHDECRRNSHVLFPGRLPFVIDSLFSRLLMCWVGHRITLCDLSLHHCCDDWWAHIIPLLWSYNLILFPSPVHRPQSPI